MNYTCKACIIDQLVLKGPAQSDDLKHACRLNADDYGSYEYMTAVMQLLAAGRIVRVGVDAFRIGDIR